MSINKWSPPVGGTGMGQNSTQTLLPINLYTPMRGVEGAEMGASYLHKITISIFDILKIHYL